MLPRSARNAVRYLLNLDGALAKQFASVRVKHRATVGTHFTCGADTSVFLEDSDIDHVHIGNYVTMVGVELRCYRKGRVSIGDHCWFSLRTQIISCTHISIGSCCIFARDVYISDTNEHPTDPYVRQCETIAQQERGAAVNRYLADTQPIAIGDNVWIGERSCLLKGIKIGNGAIIGANAVVTKDVPANCIAAGNPARIVKRLMVDSQERTP